ncbi:MAG: hypothetical protein JKY67_21665 [Pseudomonadales bacterium]|nr:hypothetical protein [Pseudomonadales bacterium]
MSEKNEILQDEYLDQAKLIRTLRVLIKAVEQLPETPKRDAIWGGLEVALEEAKKPLMGSTETKH